MAFDKYKDGAWQEPESGVKRYADGAWQDCESAKRYVDGAWQEVWTAATYFLKKGVLENGATLGTNGVQGSGSVYGSTSNYNDSIDLVSFRFTSDMVGKKLYVNAGPNVILDNSTGGYGYLSLTYPVSDIASGSVRCKNSVGGLFTFDITASYVEVSRNSRIGISNTSGNTDYHIYDIYVK